MTVVATKATRFLNITVYKNTCKNCYGHETLNCINGKAIPLQAWTGPEGSRRLRLPDLKTIGT